MLSRLRRGVCRCGGVPEGVCGGQGDVAALLLKLLGGVLLCD